MNPPTFESGVSQQIKQQDLGGKELPLFHKNYTQLFNLLPALEYVHGDSSSGFWIRLSPLGGKERESVFGNLHYLLIGEGSP